MEHKVEPIRKGREVMCRVCDRLVMNVRATRLIPKRHWKHQGHQQGRGGTWTARRDEDGRFA